MLVRHGRTEAERIAAIARADRTCLSTSSAGARPRPRPGTRCSARPPGSSAARCRGPADTAAALGLPVTVDDAGPRSTTASTTGRRWRRSPSCGGAGAWTSAYAPEGGESLAAVGARVREACDELWPEAADRDVVVVSHVSPIKAAVAWALGVGDEISWRMFVDVASLTTIGPGRSRRRVGPGPVLRTFNETQHRPSQ